MASEAEARIRVKAERLLRQLWPDARIVHEIDLGGVRLDLAAITPERLILVEIKSERDTLSRLERQVEAASSIGGLVLVMVAERWVAGFPRLRGRCLQMVEDGDDFMCFLGERYRYPLTVNHVRDDADRYDNRRLMGLLLKPELYALAKPYGAKTKHDVPALQQIAHERLTGQEIRRGVMAALRARHFGWTCDAPAGSLAA